MKKTSSAPLDTPTSEGTQQTRNENIRAEKNAQASRDMIKAVTLTPLPYLSINAGVREEAAALFAAGAVQKATELLLNHINKTKGNCDKSIWFMLMDIYQSTHQQPFFEKLASFYSSHFHTSPPAWDERKPNAAPSRSGLNVLVVDGILNAIRPEKVRSFIQSAREMGTAKIDLSRARLSDEEANRAPGLKILLDLMTRLRLYRVKTLLMGETHIAEQMRAAVAGFSGPDAKIYWLLLLELMQWRGQRLAFEDVANRYTDKFDITAPDYETEGVIAIAPSDEERNLDTDLTGTVFFPPEVREREMDTALIEAQKNIHHSGAVRLDFSAVNSVTYDAATRLATFLHGIHLNADRVTVVKPSELIEALFDIAGVSGLIVVERLKR